MAFGSAFPPSLAAVEVCCRRRVARTCPHKLRRAERPWPMTARGHGFRFLPGLWRCASDFSQAELLEPSPGPGCIRTAHGSVAFHRVQAQTSAAAALGREGPLSLSLCLSLGICLFFLGHVRDARPASKPSKRLRLDMSVEEAKRHKALCPLLRSMLGQEAEAADRLKALAKDEEAETKPQAVQARNLKKQPCRGLTSSSISMSSTTQGHSLESSECCRATGLLHGIFTRPQDGALGVSAASVRVALPLLKQQALLKSGAIGSAPALLGLSRTNRERLQLERTWLHTSEPPPHRGLPLHLGLLLCSQESRAPCAGVQAGIKTRVKVS